MNYNDKINQVYDEIGQLGQELVHYIEKEGILNNKTGENIYRVNETQAKNINKFMELMKLHINKFNYYIEFYPNKEKVWDFQIKNVNILLNFINEMKLEG